MPMLLATGSNDTPIWGMTAVERLRRLAGQQALPFGAAAPTDGDVLVADLAFAFDPAWLRWLAGQGPTAVTVGGTVALARVPAAHADDPLAAPGISVMRYEDGGTIYNETLRKRETPFLLPLTPATVPAIERASYEGAYKGVTDALTKYLWRDLAFHLTRGAVRLRITPNMISLVGALCCIAAFFLFWDARYWMGTALGFTFMVLDTVDGKLARCTVTSSPLGNALDHGVDLVHPPFWWWAWLAGLATYGTPLPGSWHAPLLIVLVGGYVAQRLIEGEFLRRWKMDMHVWRPFDSHFRLITARRNPNMAILVPFLAFGRPDLGIVAVAVWTLISLVVHLVRLAQALRAPQPIVSWLG
jgi:phosphatidylglycerophosphate synthase